MREGGWGGVSSGLSRDVGNEKGWDARASRVGVQRVGAFKVLAGMRGSVGCWAAAV